MEGTRSLQWSKCTYKILKTVTNNKNPYENGNSWITIFCCNLSNKLVFVMIDPSVTSQTKKKAWDNWIPHTYSLSSIMFPTLVKGLVIIQSSGLFAKKKKEHQRANKSGKKNYGKTQMGVIGSSLVIILDSLRGQQIKLIHIAYNSEFHEC